MEGVGSRLGRASSRYGTATAVFTGPVRKWKKKWVHVSQSTLTYQNNSNSHSHSQSQSTTTTTTINNNNGGSRLILCRWTPLSPTPAAAAATADSGSGSADEPPRRKFRYTPIAVLEEQKRAVVKKAEDEAITSEMRPNSDEVLKEETQDSHISHLDLGLCLTGPNSNVDSVGQNRESQMESASSSGFGQHIEVQNFLKTN